MKSLHVALVFGCALWQSGCLEQPEPEAEHTQDAELIGGRQATAGEWDSSLFWVSNGGSCGGARVGARHILTAAHCVQVIDRDNNRMYGEVRADMQDGYAILVTNNKQLDNSTRYAQMAIKRTIMHPLWSESCAQGCLFRNAVVGPFPPDLALIELKADLPASVPFAKIELGPIVPGTEVTITGYGCEDGLYGGFRTPGKNKFSETTTQSFYAVQHSSSFVPSAQSGEYERAYVITPGQDPSGAASLCLADSGSPLFLKDTSSGDVVVGVNAYYTFTDIPSGFSTTNAHTRLGFDNPHGTAAWLMMSLPMESFSTSAPLGALEGAEAPARDVEISGSDDTEELDGAAEPELLLGLGGDDTLSGAGSGDVLDDGEGSDWLLGEDGDDWLEGGPGVDILDGGRGFDTMRGGLGADIYILRPGSEHDVVFGDTSGPNQVVCVDFEAPLELHVAGPDMVLMSQDGADSLRIKASRISTFYGCF